MYGLIGKKLGHSFSASFFNEKFRSENIDEEYRLFPIPDISEVTALINRYKDLKGFNVTIPYKEAIIPYLSEISDEARDISAVNVVKIRRGEDSFSLSGYNSDAIGFRKSIEPLLKPHMTRALVLGTGGASKAVVHVLQTLGIEVERVSRNRSADTLTYSDLSPEIMGLHHIIVNTTPLGMWPDIEDCPEIPYMCLTNRHLCYDVVYNPEMTLFMKKAAERGAAVKNGLEMLHLQALAAWDIWNRE